MFNLFKPKTQTVFVSGIFYKEVSPEDTHVFFEYGLVGKGQTHATPYDFIKAVHQMHRTAGFRTKFEIVKF